MKGNFGEFILSKLESWKLTARSEGILKIFNLRIKNWTNMCWTSLWIELYENNFTGGKEFTCYWEFYVYMCLLSMPDM